MSAPEPAAAPAARQSAEAIPTESLLLRLDGFEGPLDLLLELARGQKVDLARISILALVEQYLSVIEGAQRIRLELAADWLVMAAWLTWLKSRLLLPPGTDEADEGELAADVLAARLRDLQVVRLAAVWLNQQPQLGQDVFARGQPEDLTETDRSRLALDVPGLVRAYLTSLRRSAGNKTYRPRPVTLWSVKDALGRLGNLLGSLPDWTTLERFLPPDLATPLERRAALASTLIAGLELAKGGGLRLRQDAAFGPILLRGGEEDE
jgi:segregation and condensation protein A